MKRVLYLSALCLIAATLFLRGQDSPAPSAQVSRQEAEENYKSLEGKVQSLIDTQEVQAKKMADLAAQIRDLRETASKPAGNFATPDDLKHLADAINKVDQDRVADNEKIMKELARLQKLLNAPVSAPRHKPSTDTPDPGPTPTTSTGNNNKTDDTGPGYWYEIKSGDNFHKIAALYTQQGIKVTPEQIEKANPKVKPTELIVGKKIFIPSAQAPAAGKTQ